MGSEGAYPDPVVTSCHVRVAMGLVALLLLIGAWSGVKHLDTWCVCATLGARSVRMRTVSSDANVGLCSPYICWCVYVYVNVYICAWCHNSSSPTNLNKHG